MLRSDRLYTPRHESTTAPHHCTVGTEHKTALASPSSSFWQSWRWKGRGKVGDCLPIPCWGRFGPFGSVGGGRGHLGVRPKKISWYILIYLDRSRDIPNWGYLKDIVNGYKGYLFGYERISFLDMKGYPWHIHLYPALIHRSLSVHIQSYPIISTVIHRYPYEIQQFILSYPWTYPLISIDLSYVISFNIQTDIQKLIHLYPNIYSSDIQYLSRDILPFILLDIRPGFGWSGLPRRAAAGSLHASNCVYLSTHMVRTWGQGPAAWRRSTSIPPWRLPRRRWDGGCAALLGEAAAAAATRRCGAQPPSRAKRSGQSSNDDVHHVLPPMAAGAARQGGGRHATEEWRGMRASVCAQESSRKLLYLHSRNSNW